MYNVYHGSGGAPQRVAEPRGDSGPPAPPPFVSHGAMHGRGGLREPIQQTLEGLVSRITSELETEDLILLLILYLMYRESGDTELLLIMGAMYLL